MLVAGRVSWADSLKLRAERWLHCIRPLNAASCYVHPSLMLAWYRAKTEETRNVGCAMTRRVSRVSQWWKTDSLRRKDCASTVSILTRWKLRVGCNWLRLDLTSITSGGKERGGGRGDEKFAPKRKSCGDVWIGPSALSVPPKLTSSSYSLACLISNYAINQAKLSFIVSWRSVSNDVRWALGR